MNILGFTDWLSDHNTSAAIISDGVLIAAAEEERFSRRKYDGAPPFSAIDFCLRRAGISMAQVDFLALACKPFRSGPDSQLAEMDSAFLHRLQKEGSVRWRSVIHKCLLDTYLRFRPGSVTSWGMDKVVAAGFASMRERFGHLPRARFYDHHQSHAAAAYYSSKLGRAAVATIDGRGGSYATVAWNAETDRITRLRAEPFTNSLGIFYEDCSIYLGLGKFGQGKMMGLASYGKGGKIADRVSRLVEFNDLQWYQYRTRPGPHVLGFHPRFAEPLLDSPYPDFAAACQRTLEHAVARVVRSTIEEARCQDLCLGGGVTLNCSSNGALLSSGIASSIWIFPASGDAGLSVGAAMLCAAQIGELRRTQLNHAYWGPDFSASEYEAALKREPRVVYQREANLFAEVARYLATGKVIGWFQGRMELGPRALGNRSILADPRRVEIRDRVNGIKGREQWRPLAPVVLAECAAEYFALDVVSPFMLFATQVRPEKRPMIPAVVHVDGTARPQTVTREQNHRLYDLIFAFRQLTQVPVLLNTSFNAAEEPIVCSPQDAIETFLATGLDILVLGDWIVSRRATDG
jgi:carbamoyltransferase